ncbi:GLUG motif-containing protein, partial [uncultured Ruminococcus sp.]|uniref:GLUG motif-containing protein n=1 Tax=uncultured Ruminococcus sp. TaxID=165186 RepID=UPI0025E7F76F
MTKTIQRPLAFLSAVAMAIAMLLYFPSGIFSIDFGQKASAEGTTNDLILSAIAGDPEGFLDDEYTNLFDNNTGTEWYCRFRGYAYVIFQASEPVKVSKYSIATARDAKSYPNKSPKAWTLSACMNYTGDTTSWTVIDTVTDGGLPAANETYTDFTLAETTPYYQYFKLEITSNGDDIYLDSRLQISEIALKDYTLCEHQWEATGETFAPTCTEGGYYVAYCPLCQGTRNVPTEDALWHDFVEVGEACTRCGLAYSAPIEPLTDEYGVYQIETSGELYWFANYVNSGNTSANAALTANIVSNTGVLQSDGTLADDVSGFTSWSPVGWHDEYHNMDYIYTGTFDGQNHTISGLYFNNDNTDYVGLFGRVGSSGSVSNVGIVDSYFKGYDYVGGVCGENYGTITNCYLSGEVTASGDYAYVGGVCGYHEGTVTNCYYTGAVTASGDYAYVGGVCGNNEGTVTNCYHNGTVTAAGDSAWVGGVCGMNSSTITNCYHTGAVTATGNLSEIGGVCGDNWNTTTNCYFDSTVYIGNAVSADYATDTTAEGKTTAEFQSGEVAYLLQGTQTEAVWGQTIGTEKYPVLGGVKVSATRGCVTTYNNSGDTGVKEHSYDTNGFCTICGAYQPSLFNETDNCYEISNAGQLYWFAALVNGDKSVCDYDATDNPNGTKQNIAANAVLMDDITVNQNVLVDGELNPELTNPREWTPIGGYDGDIREACPYAGTFDGQRHTVSGLYFNDTSASYVGLFGYVAVVTDSNANTTSTGTIVYVGVVDSYFNGTSDVGGVCGMNIGGTITNCYNTGTVSGQKFVSGVCGINNGTITNCYNTGKVRGSYNVGGVCGANGDTIRNCYYDSDKYSGNAVGSGSGTVTGVEGKTTAAFQSGEVAYLLQSGQTAVNGTIPEVWGQNLDTDDYPVLGGAKVYQNETYAGCEDNKGEPAYSYSNTQKAPVYAAHDYSSGGICKSCDALENGKDGFKSASLTLTDGVILNYYLLLSEEALADTEAYIHFTSANGIDMTILLSEGVQEAGKYKFSLELRPDQMTEVITAQVVYSDGSTGNCVDYSVQQYAENVNEADDSKALVDAMLKFGAFTQLYTGENADNLVVPVSDYTTNASIDDTYQYQLDSNVSGISVKGATLQIGAYTTIRLKYQLAEGADIQNYTFKCGDTVLTPEKSGEFYYVYLRNIRPQDLDEMHNFTVSDGTNTTTFTYSAFTYMKHVLDNAESYDQTLVNLINAMYDYHQAAEAY